MTIAMQLLRTALHPIMTLGGLVGQRSTPSWEPNQDMPSMVGRVAMVTGASAGLGKLSALELARKGAHVFCLGRSKEKTEEAIKDIIAETGNEKVEFIQADNMDLVSMEEAANTFLARGLPLHILILNAGIMKGPWKLTKQNIESHMGVNHIAHCVLTNPLLPLLEKSANDLPATTFVLENGQEVRKVQGNSRIVVLTSVAHIEAFLDGIHYDDVNDESKYLDDLAYGSSKLANLHFAAGLNGFLQDKAMREGKKQSSVYVNSVHPGIVGTTLGLNWANQQGAFLKYAWSFFLMTPYQGSITQLYAATANEIIDGNVQGKYLIPYNKVVAPAAIGRDPILIQKTWEWTGEIIRKHFKAEWQWNL